MVPGDELAEEAFQVIRDALRKTRTIGIGQLALRGNEYLVAVKPYDKGLLLETLHYAEEVREPGSVFRGLPAKDADKELLDVATALIEKKRHKWDPSKYKNHYQAALRELIQRKMKAKGAKITVEEEEAPADRSNVIDLMSALKKSLAGGGRKPAAASRKSRARKTPAKRKAG
jgi:DNA end-binding protein Ku